MVSEETDEEFDWYDAQAQQDDTFFTLVNKNRKTVEKGDQVFISYGGNRTNKFLLLNYGFCFTGNRYDSYEFTVRITADFSSDPRP